MRKKLKTKKTKTEFYVTTWQLRCTFGVNMKLVDSAVYYAFKLHGETEGQTIRKCKTTARTPLRRWGQCVPVVPRCSRKCGVESSLADSRA